MKTSHPNSNNADFDATELSLAAAIFVVVEIEINFTFFAFVSFYDVATVVVVGADGIIHLLVAPLTTTAML